MLARRVSNVQNMTVKNAQGACRNLMYVIVAHQEGREDLLLITYLVHRAACSRPWHWGEFSINCNHYLFLFIVKKETTKIKPRGSLLLNELMLQNGEEQLSCCTAD